MGNLLDLSGRVAIITGCSRGLGQYFAKALASHGANLIITSRNLDSLAHFSQELKNEYNISVLPLELDVCNYASIQNMVEKAYQFFNKIDILVNNAGCNIRKKATEVTWDDWNLILDTNLRGAFFVAQAVAKKMMPAHYGRIINIGSVTSIFGYAGIAPYCASRGGIKQLTLSLADEWGPYGITVNCLAPGWFKTQQTAALYENEAWVNYITDRIPLKRPGQPHDLDGAVVFLASGASGYMTGQTLLIDGGITTGATKATIGS